VSQIDLRRVENTLLNGSSESISRLIREIQGSSDHGEAVVLELSHHKSPHLRAWSSNLALALPIHVGAGILARLVLDSSEDVRDVALQDLKSLAPSRLLAHLPTLRRRIGNSDSPILLIWTLTELKDLGSLPALDSLSWDEAKPPYVRNAARIAAMTLRRESSAIASAIREHDHDSMHWLVRGALLVGDSITVGALRECTAQDFDPSCRHYCSAALEEFDRSSM
jgi:hypothetical protein